MPNSLFASSLACASVAAVLLLSAHCRILRAEDSPPEKTEASSAESKSSAESASSRASTENTGSTIKSKKTSQSDRSADDKEKTATEIKLASEKEILKKPIPVTQPVKHIIGATALVVETQSELEFQARVDTGAASCSIHCEEWKIDDEAESMEENIGKPIRVLLSNHEDEREWVQSQIDRCVTVKTSEQKEIRYKVPLTLRWKDFEKQVVVTLNNRGHMNFPILLGRNFLEGDFLVDIDFDHTDSDDKDGKELAQTE